MISILPSDLEPAEAYRLLTSVIVPRPIAWVSTMGCDGSLNLAPFSYFAPAAGNPPTIVISIGQRKGKPKDTLRNVQETGEFVVNLVDETLLEAMNQTSEELPYEVNEFDLAKVQTAPSLHVRPPRVAASPIAMEASLTQVVPVEGTRFTMVLGRIIQWHIRDDLVRSDGLVDAAKLRPIARLGGDEYAVLGGVLEVPRPR